MSELVAKYNFSGRLVLLCFLIGLFAPIVLHYHDDPYLYVDDIQYRVTVKVEDVVLRELRYTKYLNYTETIPFNVTLVNYVTHQVPLDVYFVIDASTSVTDLDWDRQLQAVKAVATRLDGLKSELLRFGIGQYATEFSESQPLRPAAPTSLPVSRAFQHDASAPSAGSVSAALCGSDWATPGNRCTGGAFQRLVDSENASDASAEECPRKTPERVIVIVATAESAAINKEQQYSLARKVKVKGVKILIVFIDAGVSRWLPWTQKPYESIEPWEYRMQSAFSLSSCCQSSEMLFPRWGDGIPWTHRQGQTSVLSVGSGRRLGGDAFIDCMTPILVCPFMRRVPNFSDLLPLAEKMVDDLFNVSTCQERSETIQEHYKWKDHHGEKAVLFSRNETHPVNLISRTLFKRYRYKWEHFSFLLLILPLFLRWLLQRVFLLASKASGHSRREVGCAVELEMQALGADAWDPVQAELQGIGEKEHFPSAGNTSQGNHASATTAPNEGAFGIGMDDILTDALHHEEYVDATRLVDLAQLQAAGAEESAQVAAVYSKEAAHIAKNYGDALSKEAAFHALQASMTATLLASQAQLAAEQTQLLVAQVDSSPNSSNILAQLKKLVSQALSAATDAFTAAVDAKKARDAAERAAASDTFETSLWCMGVAPSRLEARFRGCFCGPCSTLLLTLLVAPLAIWLSDAFVREPWMIWLLDNINTLDPYEFRNRTLSEKVKFGVITDEPDDIEHFRTFEDLKATLAHWKGMKDGMLAVFDYENTLRETNGARSHQRAELRQGGDTHRFLRWLNSLRVPIIAISQRTPTEQNWIRVREELKYELDIWQLIGNPEAIQGLRRWREIGSGAGRSEFGAHVRSCQLIRYRDWWYGDGAGLILSEDRDTRPSDKAAVIADFIYRNDLRVRHVLFVDDDVVDVYDVSRVLGRMKSVSLVYGVWFQPSAALVKHVDKRSDLLRSCLDDLKEVKEDGEEVDYVKIEKQRKEIWDRCTREGLMNLTWCDKAVELILKNNSNSPIDFRRPSYFDPQASLKRHVVTDLHHLYEFEKAQKAPSMILDAVARDEERFQNVSDLIRMCNNATVHSSPSVSTQVL